MVYHMSIFVELHFLTLVTGRRDTRSLKMHGLWAEMTKFRIFFGKTSSNRLNLQKKNVFFKFDEKGHLLPPLI